MKIVTSPLTREENGSISLPADGEVFHFAASVGVGHVTQFLQRGDGVVFGAGQANTRRVGGSRGRRLRLGVRVVF